MVLFEGELGRISLKYWQFWNDSRLEGNRIARRWPSVDFAKSSILLTKTRYSRGWMQSIQKKMVYFISFLACCIVKQCRLELLDSDSRDFESRFWLDKYRHWFVSWLGIRLICCCSCSFSLAYGCERSVRFLVIEEFQQVNNTISYVLYIIIFYILFLELFNFVGDIILFAWRDGQIFFLNLLAFLIYTYLHFLIMNICRQIIRSNINLYNYVFLFYI